MVKELEVMLECEKFLLLSNVVCHQLSIQFDSLLMFISGSHHNSC